MCLCEERCMYVCAHVRVDIMHARVGMEDVFHASGYVCMYLLVCVCACVCARVFFCVFVCLCVRVCMSLCILCARLHEFVFSVCAFA